MIFTGPNKENLAKYGKNFPYKAWLPENVTPTSSVDEVYTCKGNPKTVLVVVSVQYQVLCMQL